MSVSYHRFIWLKDAKSKYPTAITFDDGLDKIHLEYSVSGGSDLSEKIMYKDVVGCHRMKAHRMNLSFSYKRKLVVFVNPYSGPGRALQIFQQKVMPVFAEADIICRLVITERANHARDIVAKMDLLQWDGIVIVSGDGLVYEVLNGLASRVDRDKALRIPLGVVPGGSGNALAAACCFKPNDSCKFDYAADSAVVIAKPNYADLKLIHMQTRTENIISFMSIGWGLLSDIDIESEKFRRLLGPARFTAGAVIRWASLRKYRGRLSFKMVEDSNHSAFDGKNQRIPRHSSPLIVEHRKSLETLPRPKMLRDLRPTHSCYEIQDYDPDDDVSDENNGSSTGTPGSSGFDFTAEQLTYDYPPVNGSSLPYGEVPSLTTLPNNNNVADGSSASASRRRSFLSAIDMPGLDEPVPNDWLVIEDDFILIYAVYLTHIGSDLPYMPCSRFDDGCIYVTLVRAGGTSKVNLAKFLLTIESARHLSLPGVEVYPVSAFRLERLSEGGVLAVDGELVKCSGPIQASVSCHKATIMTAHEIRKSKSSRVVMRL